MTFTAPLWLIALAPLAVVVAYLLWGRRRQAPVPFLDLWRGPVKAPRPKRRFTPPPVALLLAILSMLLAVLGAARPARWDPGGAQTVTIVVDRGATLSTGDRLAEAATAAQQVLARLGPANPVELVVVPGDGAQRTDVSQWVSHVTQLPPTAVDTTAAVTAAVARRLAETTGPVIVLTDRDVRPSGGRVVRVGPRGPVTNAGIVRVDVRRSPTPQVMVRVRGTGPGGRGGLRLSSGHDVTREVDLPGGGQTQDYFVDFDPAEEALGVSLVRDRPGAPDARDDFAGDDDAWLVREGNVPRIEPRGFVPPALRRMIEVYAAARPPTATSPLAVVTAAALPPGTAGIVLADARGGAAPADPQVVPHPVTAGTRWSFAEPLRLAAGPAAGWTPVVTLDGRVAVAVRDDPARQVWVGIGSDEWPRSAEYVVFWANVFDWLGGGDVRYVSHPVGRLGGGWVALELAGSARPATRPITPVEPGLWPGLYRRTEDGALRAVNAGDVRFPDPPAGDDGRERLAGVLDGHARGAARPVSAAVLLAAGACAALAAGLWKRSTGRNLAST